MKKIQWGTNIEVRKLPQKEPPKSEVTKNVVNFSMLYFNEKNELNEKDIPEQIIVKYSDDYNILEIDLIIKRRLNAIRKKDIVLLKDKITDEDLKMSQPQTGIERKQSIKNKAKYLEKLYELENDTELNNYIKLSSTLIDKYKLIGVKKRKINFCGDNENLLNIDDIYRQQIISKYLEIARNFIEITVQREGDDNAYCIGCGYKLDSYVDESGIKQCPNCGVEKLYLNRSYYVNDSETQQSNTHNDYDDRETFYKSLLRFQGKQNNRIPKRLWDELDKYFVSLNLPIGKQIKELENLPDGTKPGTSRPMMLKALQELGFVDCYEDINLICNIYWGWALPNISNLEDIIMEHYDLTQKVFEKIKKGKQSSLNAEYRLFKHLELVGYPCKEDDFKIIKTRDTLESCEEKWRQMCEGSGLKFIPTI